MRLQSIELKGFKSFAERTVIHFNQNMTGIIGPNGCGKSNIVDAIRWVLGEQKSSSLRLKKMDNLIFNGTQKRKPAGRAEVSLTFENTKNLLPTEFTTVVVTRILYRQGNSEYRINDVPCRLKDISNLFLDTGIGSDSYAIIELSMIGDLLKDKENSRRKLFEQAAGISKYKIRKKETLSKLQSTDGDLERVEDLLFEIEGNLKTLARQAKRAKRHEKLKSEFRELSVELALFQIADHKQSFAELQQEQKREEDKKTKLQTQIRQLEATVSEKKEAVLANEQQLAEFQKTLNKHVKYLQDQENQKKLLRQNLQFLQEKNTTLQEQITTAVQLSESLQAEIKTLREKAEIEKNSLEHIQKQLQNFKTAVETVRKEHQEVVSKRNLLQRTYRDLEKSVFGVEKKIAIQQTQQENLQREMKSNRLRFESQQNELAIFKENWEKAKAEKKAAVEELQQNKSEDTDLQSELNQLKKSIDRHQQERNQLNRQLDSKRNEYKLTKSLVDSLEGFPDSIKFLKTHKKWQVEAPLLLDVLNCEDEYKVALENYLAPHLNSYILEDVETAMKAIDLLQQAQKGKASFFILKDFEGRGDRGEESGVRGQETGVRSEGSGDRNQGNGEMEVEEILQTQFTANQNLILSSRNDLFKTQNSKFSEEIIPATSILKVEEKYIHLLHHLLQNVYIIPNTSLLTPDTSLLSPDSCLLTKNGRIIRQKASISGGSVGAYEGKRIGRRQQLQQLQKDIKEIEEKQKSLQSAVQKQQNEFHQIRKKLNQKRQLQQHQQSAINKLDNKLVGFRLKVENTEKFIGESSNRTENLKNRIEAIDKEMNALQQNLEEKKAALELQQTQLEESETNFREIEVKLQSANQQFNQQNIEFHKQENRLNSIRQNLQFKQNQFKNTQRQLEQNQTTLKKGDGESVEIEAKLKEIEGGLGALYDKKVVLEKEVSESETVYYKLRGQVNEFEEEIRTLNRNRNLVEELLTSIKDKTNQLKIQLLSLKERLSFAFKIDLDDLLDKSPSGEYEQSDLTAKVTKLQSQLERFGEVNPLAVAAYDEMKDRYDFIMEQRADLLTAKESLMKTIEEIEGKATEKFMEAFEKVRENFVEVFRTLFTSEDQCDLILQNPDDPLESRIDITAKPKGKRPQSIDQLSGGEKSLTALALIFALYLLKPAPFCVLDEVDAPLDDNNLGKYADLIKRFSEQSQFIIVTHRKVTMAAVEVAYGITMQQQGISMVVPFNFREWEAEKAKG